jgi:hypothetical protein
MSGEWKYKDGPVRVEINREALGFILDDFAGPLNSVAEVVAEEARAVLPKESMRRFIRVKSGGEIAGSNRGIWPLALRGRRYGSGTGDRLMRGVEVPVALIVNDSNLAMTWEYGTVPADKNLAFAAKDGGDGHIGRSKGERGAGGGGADQFRMYQPLTLGALKGQSKAARLVLKYRRGRR